MKDTPNITARRTLLRQEVQAHGQAEVSRRAQKPDRQIGDLIAGRVSFGDRIAKDIEQIRPDLPQGWLVFAEKTLSEKTSEHTYPAADAISAALTAREAQISYQLQELTRIWLQLPPQQRTDELLRLRSAAIAHTTEVQHSTASPAQNNENQDRHRTADGVVDLWEKLQNEKKNTPGGKPGEAK